MDKKQLLYDLFNAESSLKVHEIVVRHGLDSSENWHPYGNNLNNAGTFENQQSSPENALVEKLTNSVDAILMKHCYIKGLDPKSKTDPRVPKDMDEAIELFYGVKNGKWENVTSKDRNSIAQNIQIILTGDRKTPNVAIFDNGEGQNPDSFPDTFLSIAHGNKNDVPFVQHIKINEAEFGNIKEKHSLILPFSFFRQGKSRGERSGTLTYAACIIS